MIIINRSMGIEYLNNIINYKKKIKQKYFNSF